MKDEAEGNKPAVAGFEQKLSRSDLAWENADRTFRTLLREPAVGLTDCAEDRLEFVAFLVAYLREFKRREHTSDPIKFPGPFAMSRLRKGRTFWTETIMREDREKALKIAAWLDRRSALTPHPSPLPPRMASPEGTP